MLCSGGKKPFTGIGVANLINNILDPSNVAPELDSSVPQEVRDICKGLLDKEESKRFGFSQLI
jgi:hypothetical protein